MQVIYKLLMFCEVFTGFVIVFLILFQRSASDGLIGKVTNPFGMNSSSTPPITKVTRVLVLLFFCSSVGLVTVKSRIDKPKTIIKKDENKKIISVPNR